VSRRERTVQRILDGAAKASNDALRLLIAVARDDPCGFTLLFRYAARKPEFTPYVAELHDRDVRAAAKLPRPRSR
jgi:hypothetical protein